MRVLVLGGTGMLGHKVVQVFGKRFDTFCTIRNAFSAVERFGIFDRQHVIENVDARDMQSIRTAVVTTKPDVVINCVGIIKQLPTSQDVVQTLTVNSILPHLISEITADVGCRFITLSTDCVFSGARGQYAESDVADSTDLYGRSKQYGEVAGTNCLTIRTSIIGRELGTTHSLIDWFLSQKTGVKGYANAIFSGFPTIVLAEVLAAIIEYHRDLEGLYHVSSEPISKYDLLELVNRRLASPVEIEKETEFRLDRSLDSTKFRLITGFSPLPWPEMVDRMLSDPTPYDNWRKLS